MTEKKGVVGSEASMIEIKAAAVAARSHRTCSPTTMQPLGAHEAQVDVLSIEKERQR